MFCVFYFRGLSNEIEEKLLTQMAWGCSYLLRRRGGGCKLCVIICDEDEEGWKPFSKYLDAVSERLFYVMPAKNRCMHVSFGECPRTTNKIIYRISNKLIYGTGYSSSNKAA